VGLRGGLAAGRVHRLCAGGGLATAPGSLPAARTAGWAAGVLATITVLLWTFLVCTPGLE